MSDSPVSTAPLALEPKPSSPAPRPQAPFRAVDWVTTLVAGNTAVFLLGFSMVAGQRLGAMYADFGGRVPLLTGLVVRWYVPTGAGLLVALVLAAGLRDTTEKRRRILAGAALLGVVASGLAVYGLYAPIWELAGNIKP